MPNQYDFDWLIANPNLFCLYNDELCFMGDIFRNNEGGLLTLSGASKRKKYAREYQFYKYGL